MALSDFDLTGLGKTSPTQSAPTESGLSSFDLTGLGKTPPAESAPQPELPWYQKVLGPAERFVTETLKGANIYEPIKRAEQLRGDVGPSAETEAAMQTPAAETAGKVGKFVGQALPWVAAGALSGGVADVAGAIPAVSKLPEIAQLAGRGALTGLGVSGYQQALAPEKEKPGVRGTLQNILMGTGFELGGAAAGKLLPETLPPIVSRPAQAAAGAVAGTAATYPALTQEQRENFGKQLLEAGGPVAAADLALTLLGERGAAFRPGEAAPMEEPVTETPTESVTAPEQPYIPTETELRRNSFLDQLRQAGVDPTSEVGQGLISSAGLDVRGAERALHPVTGFQGGELHDATLNRVWDESQKTDQPFSYGYIDIHNLGGLNAFRGTHEEANIDLKNTADMIRQSLEDAGIKNSQIFNKGGDEFQVIAPYADKETLNSALANAKMTIGEYATNTGLSEIPHSKTGRSPGYGIDYAVNDFRDFSNPKDMVESTDYLVGKAKEEDRIVPSEAPEEVRTRAPGEPAAGIGEGVLPPIRGIEKAAAIPQEEAGIKQPWQMSLDEFLKQRPAVEGYGYHGSPEGDLGFIDPYYHTQSWREGIGFYTTSSRSAAKMYAEGRTATGERKGTKGEINYIEGRPKAVLDMNAPIDKELWKSIVDTRTGDSSYFIGELDGLKTNTDGYKATVNYLRDEFGTEAQYAVEESLVDKGITATAHMEGVKSGNPHQVIIHKTNEGLRITPPEEVHRKVVEKALFEGKQVPQNVLKDYPDLQAMVPPIAGKPEEAEAVPAEAARAEVNTFTKPTEPQAEVIPPPKIEDPPPAPSEGVTKGPLPEGVGAMSYKPGDKLVDDVPFDLTVLATDKATTGELLQDYTGKKNAQVVRGNQIRDQIKAMAPDEQAAITFNREAHGDVNKLQEWIDNPDENLDPYRDDIRKAMNLSIEAQNAEALANDYFAQAGELSKNLGTINGVLEDYVNRIYKPEPPEEFVKTEVGKAGISAYTAHKKARYYDTIVDAILAGKEPQTLDVSTLMGIHNEEMARVNTNKMFADDMVRKGLAEWATADTKSKGYEQVPGVRHGSETLYMPKQIAKGLASIIEPNFIKRIDTLRGLMKYQGIVKTVDLSYSLFHHITMTAQMLYQSKGGFELALRFNDIKKAISSGEINQIEQRFVRSGGMTAKVEDNRDVIRKLSAGDDLLSKAFKLPVLREAAALSEKNNELLFGKLQRWLKVIDWNNKVIEHIKKNPNLTDRELTLAQRSIANEVNAAFGGLNWEALGKTRSVQSMLRFSLLAPDWTLSNWYLAKAAFTKGPGGAAARSHYFTALVGGAILTEGMNYLYTGHTTDKNSKGHETEVEIAPNVYFSFFRGGIGDALKVVSNVVESGPQGFFRFMQGKLSPIARTAVGVLSNTDYLGRHIADAKKSTAENTWSFAKYIMSELGPIPFGVSGIKNYVTTDQTTPLGAAAVSVGAARYSKSSYDKGSVFDSPSKKSEGNWLQKFVGSPQEKAASSMIDKLRGESKARTAQEKLMDEELGRSIKSGDNAAIRGVLSKYNVPANQQKEKISNARSRLKVTQSSALVQEYSKLSKERQAAFVRGLSPEERNLLTQELRAAGR